MTQTAFIKAVHAFVGILHVYAFPTQFFIGIAYIQYAYITIGRVRSRDQMTLQTKWLTNFIIIALNWNDIEFFLQNG